MNKRERGFTLIELLVVIAIIGLLTLIALASLNSARTKAADSAVRAGLDSLRAQSEIFYDTNGNYNGNGTVAISSCTAAGSMFMDPTVITIRDNIQKNLSGSGTIVCTTDAIGQKWAVSVTGMKGGGTWCIDNQNWNNSTPVKAANTGTCS